MTISPPFSIGPVSHLQFSSPCHTRFAASQLSPSVLAAVNKTIKSDEIHQQSLGGINVSRCQANFSAHEGTNLAKIIVAIHSGWNLGGAWQSL
jgi:hypothetical protein